MSGFVGSYGKHLDSKFGAQATHMIGVACADMSVKPIRLMGERFEPTPQSWDAVVRWARGINDSQGWLRVVPARVYADGAFLIDFAEFARS